MLHNYLTDIVIRIHNIFAPHNKTTKAIINTMNKIIATSDITLQNSQFWNSKFLKTRTYALQIMPKMKKADNCKKQIRYTSLTYTLFTSLV